MLFRKLVQIDKLLGNETLSDHKFIYFKIKDTKTIGNRGLDKPKTQVDWKAFETTLEWIVGRRYRDDNLNTIDTCTKTIKKVYLDCQFHRPGKMRRPYWWNEQIETKRAECTKTRRFLTRCKNYHGSEYESLMNKYKTDKEALNNQSVKAKKVSGIV